MQYTNAKTLYNYTLELCPAAIRLKIRGLSIFYTLDMYLNMGTEYIRMKR
jgi:hypothetical protein